MRLRYARILRVVETFALAAGLGLLAVYGGARVHAVAGRAEALEAFAVAQAVHDGGSLEAGAAAPAASALPELGAPDQSLWGKNRIAAYRVALESAAEPPLGVLEVPKLELRVPVFEGTGELALNRGVGRIEGTAALTARGNVGIAGHRDGFFRGLKDIARGDAIVLRSLGGASRYRVTEILVVEPTDVHVLHPTDAPTLTLVTCYPFYFIGDAPQRYIVKAELESVLPDGVRASG